MNQKIFEVFSKLSPLVQLNLFKAIERKEWFIVTLERENLIGVCSGATLPPDIFVKEKCGPWFLGSFDKEKTDRTIGLATRYDVKRIDKKEDKPGSRYFVLNYIHCRHSAFALLGFAKSCEKDYPYLARDLRFQSLKGCTIEHIVDAWHIYFPDKKGCPIPNSGHLSYQDALEAAFDIIWGAIA